MKKVVFSVSPFVEPFEILGEDLEVYVLQPNSTVVIPELNAKALEKHNIGRIVGEFRQPERDLDELLHQQKDTFTFGHIGEYDIIRDWAKMMLEAELRKPKPDPDKVIEYKMLMNGINPTQFLYKSRDTKVKETIINVFNPKDNNADIKTHSQTQSPTGLCSPSDNTVQVEYFERIIEDDEFKWEGQKLKRAFETYGFKCVNVLQAYRVKGLDELDLSGYAILDYGYTRVELHEEFAKLLKEFGYDLEKDCMLVLLFEEYECPKHGKVYKPAADFEMRVYKDEDKEIKKHLKVFAGRIHPYKKYHDSKRYSAQKLEQFRLIAEAAREKGIVSFRQFDGELKKVRHFGSDLALLWMVFTVPDRISRGFQRFIEAYPDRRDVEKLMRKAVRSTLRRFLRKYLKKHENIPLNGDFKEGGLMNVHLWSSRDPRKGHVHVHVCLWNIVLWNGQIVRFSPYITKEWLAELRKIWAKELFKWLNKFDGVKAWIDPFTEEDYDSFNIYNSYTWLDMQDGEFEQAGRILHHLRYNARKAVVDLNEFFYSGMKADELDKSEKEWIRFLVSYSNRTSNFGFMNNWRKTFDVPKDAVIEALEKVKREHYEYCPICKQRMEYKGIVTIDEILKNEKLLVLWWFDRRMNIEIWWKDNDYG